jgi:AcrR family transcriptional regulator
LTCYDDPRPGVSRARLLDAATALLQSGGPNAVTVDAVTRTAKVARATLYRHYPSGNDLIAAAFAALLPPAPIPSQHGSLRERLTALVVSHAESRAQTPLTLTAACWLMLGGHIDASPTGSNSRRPKSAEVVSLRTLVTQQYAVAFDATFDSPQALAELGRVDRTQAIALLTGPILLGKLSTLTDFDYTTCARSAVDGFLATHNKSTANVGKCSRHHQEEQRCQ